MLYGICLCAFFGSTFYQRRTSQEQDFSARPAWNLNELKTRIIMGRVGVSESLLLEIRSFSDTFFTLCFSSQVWPKSVKLSKSLAFTPNFSSRTQNGPTPPPSPHSQRPFRRPIPNSQSPNIPRPRLSRPRLSHVRTFTALFPTQNPSDHPDAAPESAPSPGTQRAT